MKLLKKEVNKMNSLIEKSWYHFCEFRNENYIVSPSIPILYFGDQKAYSQSEIKILTVGLNPSKIEFMANDPLSNEKVPSFFRFIGGEKLVNKNILNEEEKEEYQLILNKYYKEPKANPYRRWFNSFEYILHGIDASYYDRNDYTNRALHIDICTPLATDPTWTGLDKSVQRKLEAPGREIYGQLLEVLQPDIILISVRKEYLNKMKLKEKKLFKQFTLRGDGSEMVRPYKVFKYFNSLESGKEVEVFFGMAGLVPFMYLCKEHKLTLGRAIKDYINR